MFEDNTCNYIMSKKYFTCNNFFKGANYIELKLMNENMNITLELDNYYRYSLIKDEYRERINIIDR